MSTAPSLLKALRAVVPQRGATFTESLRVAELQAAKLAERFDPAEGVQEADLNALPRIDVVRDATIGVSGMSHWNGECWVITLNGGDAPARQRFTLLHEFKHIVDHGQIDRLYAGNRDHTRAEQAEIAADYFAGCALVPKRRLKSAWGRGIQQPATLADYFGVSEHAIRVRLTQTGLSAVTDPEPSPRCARQVTTPRQERQRFHPARPTYRRTPA